jgi:hypothetical protein
MRHDAIVLRAGFLAALFALLAPGISLRAAEDTVTRCDELASHPLDPARVAPGQATGDIDLPLAIATCREDADAHPDNARIRYQLGRVLFYAGQFDEAMVEMRRSAEGGHAQAQFVYGIFVIKGRPGAPADPCIASRMWQAAAEGGRYAATVHYAMQRLRGTFDDCADPARAADLDRWLSEAEEAAEQSPSGYDGYYRRLFIDDLKYRLGQAAAT